MAHRLQKLGPYIPTVYPYGDADEDNRTLI
jgi:hypothetical protein